MDEVVTQFASFSGGHLSDVLHRTCGGTEGVAIQLGLLVEDTQELAELDSARTGRSPRSGNSDPFPMVCVAKAFTGTLALLASVESRLCFDDCLPALGEPCLKVFDGVTVRDLLSHAHGIDASHMVRVPRAKNGWIDLPQLCNQLNGSPRLFPAGTSLSYSSAGFWLVAAILERIYLRKYADILISQMLAPAGLAIPSRHILRTSVCPAAGGDAALSVPDYLQLLKWFISRRDLSRHPEMQSPHNPPGWSLDLGSGAGWRGYGSNWHGHNTIPAKRTLVIRVHPDGVGIVVAARGMPASVAMLRVFGKNLPEYRLMMQIPRLIRTLDLSIPASRFTGTYVNRAITVNVYGDSIDRLSATIAVIPSGGTQVVRRVTSLQPGADSSFLTTPPISQIFRWIQFIPRGSHCPTHLWDGLQVLRRVGGI